MKTDELIALLADAGAQVDRSAMRRRFWLPPAIAVLGSLALVWAVLGPRPDWRGAIALPMFWMKFAFTGAMAIAALFLLHRLGQPGRRAGALAIGPVLPLVIVWLMAAASLSIARAGERDALVLGASWLQCLVSIPVLSVPAFVLCFMAIRSLAPTRPVLAGAAAGLAAGSVAAFAYALHCTEMQAPFLAVWYVAGMLVPAAAGALLGPRLLRW